MRGRTKTGWVALLAVVGVLAAACGGSSSSSGSGGTPDTTQAPITAVAGCENGWTDPMDLAPDRKPARCQAGAPAPQPLPEKTKITLTASTLKAEFIAPLRFALAKGEFAKENLEVEFKQVPVADAVGLLAQGQIDAMWSGPDAGFMNAINGGFPIRWVMGNYSSSAESKTGLWARVQDGREPTLGDLKGETVGTVVGGGSVSMYPMREALRGANLGLDQVKFQVLPAADVVTALQNGGINAAWLIDPLWTQVDNDPGFKFLVGQPMGEPLGGLNYGPNLTEKNRDAGVAFIRALIRTVNTYFAGDYKADPAFTQEVADIIELPLATYKAVPAQVMDWEIRDGTTDRLQETFFETKTINYKAAMPESQLVDRSFYERAVGHTG